MEERYSKRFEMRFFHHILGLATDAPLILKAFMTVNEIHAFKKAISTRHGGLGPGGVQGSNWEF